jgi:hypothetical protein
LPQITSSMENVDMKTTVTGMDARELQMPQLVCLRNSLSLCLCR